MAQRENDRWLDVNDIKHAFEGGIRAEMTVRGALERLPHEQRADVYREAIPTLGEVIGSPAKVAQSFVLGLVEQGKLTQKSAGGKYTGQLMVNAGTADKLER
jgi:hypothetical protein